MFPPKIFNALADFIAWVLHQHGIAHQLHYLDDFLFHGAPYSDEAARALESVSRVLRMVGVPVAVHETEGPTTLLIFIGTVIDTHTRFHCLGVAPTWDSRNFYSGKPGKYIDTLYSRAKTSSSVHQKPYLPLFSSKTADKFMLSKKASVMSCTL